MKERIEHLRHHEECGFSRKFIEDVQEILIMFADSIAKLQADVDKLIAQNGASDTAAAVAAAVAAKDAQDAAAVDAVDAKVVAALTPAPPAPPAAPAA